LAADHRSHSDVARGGAVVRGLSPVAGLLVVVPPFLLLFGIGNLAVLGLDRLTAPRLSWWWRPVGLALIVAAVAALRPWSALLTWWLGMMT
jgi:hypothetical protein